MENGMVRRCSRCRGHGVVDGIQCVKCQGMGFVAVTIEETKFTASLSGGTVKVVTGVRTSSEIKDRMMQDLQEALDSAKKHSELGDLIIEIEQVYRHVKDLEILFGVGGNEAAEAYCGIPGKYGTRELGGGTANYGRCQAYWTIAREALEKIVRECRYT